MENLVNKLDTMISEYKIKKAELETEAKKVLAPMWDDVLKLQGEIKQVKLAEKKAKRIAQLKEELAKLEG